MSAQMPPKPHDQNLDAGLLCDQSKTPAPYELVDENSNVAIGSKGRLKRSNNTSDLNIQTIETACPIQVGGSIISEFYSANVGGDSDVHNVNIASDKVMLTEGYVPKLKFRVIGAYFENLGSKSVTVYSIAVMDADKKTWFVKRRYRNFERLHHHLKDIPNYTLHLPPKRIFSSSTEDEFVHQRCIQLDKNLHDLLSIANIAEQQEAWDFLSMSSKSYSFGRSSSVVRTLGDISKAYAYADINLPEDANQAKFESVTLPDNFALDLLDVDDYNPDGSSDTHLMRHEDISLTDRSPGSLSKNRDQIPAGYIMISLGEDVSSDPSLYEDNSGSRPMPVEDRLKH